MPVIPSRYQATRGLRHGHAATIFSALLPAPAGRWTKLERLELDDGDFLDTAWSQHGHARLAILSHGLEGSFHSSYIPGLAAPLVAAGWDVLAWNYRSCGGTPNRLARSYHSGETGDLRHLVHLAARHYPQMDLIGFSLGGNVTLKYAGEAPPHPSVRSATAVSAPVDLASSARALDTRRGNRLYQTRFLKTLLAKAREKAVRFPDRISPGRLSTIRTIHDFDEWVTAPLHGFSGAADYYRRASSLPFLAALPLPSLLLNARNDPLLDAPSFPTAAALENPRFFLEVPDHGGHVGFPGLPRSLRPWHEARILEFLLGLEP